MSPLNEVSLGLERIKASWKSSCSRVNEPALDQHSLVIASKGPEWSVSAESVFGVQRLESVPCRCCTLCILGSHVSHYPLPKSGYGLHGSAERCKSQLQFTQNRHPVENQTSGSWTQSVSVTAGLTGWNMSTWPCGHWETGSQESNDYIFFPIIPQCLVIFSLKVYTILNKIPFFTCSVWSPKVVNCAKMDGKWILWDV